MSLFDAFRHRLRPLLRRRDFDREMDEEFRLHLELGAQEFPEQDDPAAHARARFGSQAYYMEETRRMTPLGWLDALGQDLRYATRNLLRSPVFTSVTVVSLAIGIGANSAIFSLIYSILLQPLPVTHPEQLVEVQHSGPDWPNDLFSYNEYQALRQSPGFTDITALGGAAYVPIAAGGFRGSAGVDAVEGNYFSTIGLRPVVGRLIAPEDERSHAPVAVISDALWEQLFDRAPGAIGSAITMGATPFTVIGVAPRAYQGLGYPGSFDAAVPLSSLPLLGGSSVEAAAADSATLQIVGRLTDPSAAPRVAEMMNAAYRSCCATDTSNGSGTGLTSIEHGIPSFKFDIHAMFSRLLLELLGAAAIVLLAACANIATLLLARASARQRELAVRLSLGASRRRLAAQMFVESGVLAAIGALAGLLMADWALRLIAHRLPGPIVDRVGLQLTGEVLGFTAVVAVVSVLLFGAVPAWRAARTNSVAALKEGGHSHAAPRSGLLDRSVVVAQVALALVLLNGAGLFVATLRNLRNVDGGFATDRRVSIELDSRGTSYESDGLGAVSERLLTRAERIPGVRSAALSEAVPGFGGRRIDWTVAVEGYTPSRDERMGHWFDPVTPGFFSTLGIGLRMGREFTPDDGAAGQKVAIVNEAFVRQYIRGRNPLGTTIRAVAGADTILMQIVGVAGDARYNDPRQPASPMVYVPLAQFDQIPVFGHLAVLTLTVHTIGDDRAVTSSVRNAVLAEVPGVRVDGPEAIEASMDATLNREILTADLATLFGAVALVLAAIGLYGVVAYQVSQRTREIGVRMALGSAPSSVVWMVLKQGLVLVGIGVLVGAPLAFGGGRAIAAELFGLAGQSRLFLLGAAVLLVGVAVAASALPARRAAKVDPLIALRAD
ncbi:MAG TPA: ABC transporter permease [Gemmatimonadales bacterium]|nr:ABC transporter permease [Gemmatimonadales bacterium]